eukprot:TRINITY_DN2097_c0_g2_i1.p1 TRINITY_DN2097_c0_g2~~TRINITY_DN2097_c0_g2_i1.p1  ORF type:complete len:297 (+),score=43.17 TRINITY_DN2097_c0_g2_i1:2-892(+)
MPRDEKGSWNSIDTWCLLGVATLGLLTRRSTRTVLCSTSSPKLEEIVKAPWKTSASLAFSVSCQVYFRSCLVTWACMLGFSHYSEWVDLYKLHYGNSPEDKERREKGRNADMYYLEEEEEKYSALHDQLWKEEERLTAEIKEITNKREQTRDAEFTKASGVTEQEVNNGSGATERSGADLEIGEEEKEKLAELARIRTYLKRVWNKNCELLSDITLAKKVQRYSFWQHFHISHWGGPVIFAPVLISISLATMLPVLFLGTVYASIPSRISLRILSKDSGRHLKILQNTIKSVSEKM